MDIDDVRAIVRKYEVEPGIRAQRAHLYNLRIQDKTPVRHTGTMLKQATTPRVTRKPSTPTYRPRKSRWKLPGAF
jgi:hypothetical protein